MPTFVLVDSNFRIGERTVSVLQVPLPMFCWKSSLYMSLVLLS